MHLFALRLHDRARPVPILLAVALLGFVLCTPATAQRRQRGQPIPEAPLFELLPADYPYPLIRVCSTAEGICLIPFTVPPGQPCSCRRPDGTWVDGVCIR